MKKVSILDCTLRDGGFINDWNFHHETIHNIYNRLDMSGIDFIEVGFIDHKRDFDINRTIFPDTKSLDAVFKGIKKRSAVPVAMIDYGICDEKTIDTIDDNDESFVDGIRVMFKKSQIASAISFCSALKDKGYKIFMQPVSITTYSDHELSSLIKDVNSVEPFSVSMVDTYGLLHSNDLMHYFSIIDTELNNDAYLGYHSHNNFQLAYANSIELIEKHRDRNIMIDSSIYGMGKSAGNANTELIAMYMNRYCGGNYNISNILELIDSDILQLHREYGWGYSFSYYISALNDCHPNYVKNLVDRKTLSMSSINEILGEIDTEIKLTYNEHHINDLYSKYQRKIKNKVESTNLQEPLKKKEIVFIGPGKSMDTELNTVKKYVQSHDCIVISCNYIPKTIKVDYVFISNSKRYDNLCARLEENIGSAKIIATTNINESVLKIDHYVDYGPIFTITKGNDSALLMFLEFVSSIGIKTIKTAGFDGLSTEGQEDYIAGMKYDINTIDAKKNNETVNKALLEISAKIEIKSITMTKYSLELVQ